MGSLASLKKISFRFATSCIVAAGFSMLGAFGCAAEAEDTGSSADELNSHASEAGIREWSTEARGIVAVANDRWLSVDDYVYRVRISRVTAEAIVAVRNGTNGVNESRPTWVWSGGSSSSTGGPVPPPVSHGAAGDDGPSTTVSHSPSPNPSPYPYPNPYPCSSGWGGSSGTGGWAGPDTPIGSSGGTSGSTSGSMPPPYYGTCHVEWQLGGDDESFARLSELDALPGTDVSAFHRLRDFAYQNGYVQFTTPPSVDAGPPTWPHVDAGPTVHSDGGHH